MNHIGPHPLHEMYAPGLEIDGQCARCGSSFQWFECWDCGGYGCHEEDYDGKAWMCETCHGDGGWNSCMSSPEWCKANPLPGREDVQRGAIEWFTVEVED